MQVKKDKKLKKLINTGEYDADIAKYIPATLEFLDKEYTRNAQRYWHIRAASADFGERHGKFRISKIAIQ